MDIRENKVRVINPRFVMDVVLTCEGDDPGFESYRVAIQSWADDHAELLESEPYDHICVIAATAFPRVITIEVCDPDTMSGVVVHPWPGS